MIFNYGLTSNDGGVYKISNVSNDRVYIGSTFRFKTRWNLHRNDLLVNRHLNTFLQNDFNKCGTDSFVFEILEIVNGDKVPRLSREQHHLDIHYDKQQQCYNLRPDARDGRGGNKNKFPPNRETDGRCRSPSPETLLKRGQAIREAKSTPEQKEKARQNCLNGRWKNHSANVTVTNLVTKEIATITGSVREWCLLRNLSYKAFNQLLNGKIKSSGGWVTFPESGIYLSLE
jgi:group I intron endonuclease